MVKIKRLEALLMYRLSLMLIGTSSMALSINAYYMREKFASLFYEKKGKKDMIQELFDNNPMPQPQLSQMQKLQKTKNIDVAIVKNKAYWVQDNILYQADIHSSGEILTDEAKPVDVINMPEKQLKHIIEIVDSFNR